MPRHRAASEYRWTWEPRQDGRVICHGCGQRITLKGEPSIHSGQQKLSWHMRCWLKRNKEAA